MLFLDSGSGIFSSLISDLGSRIQHQQKRGGEKINDVTNLFCSHKFLKIVKVRDWQRLKLLRPFWISPRPPTKIKKYLYKKLANYGGCSRTYQGLSPKELYVLPGYLKGTQDWDFFWLRFWNLYYFFIIYVKILRFYQKIFLIRPLLGEIRFFRLVWD
jgi:hypothetical protein